MANEFRTKLMNTRNWLYRRRLLLDADSTGLGETAAGDPHWAKVVFLTHADDPTDHTHNFYDESTYGRTLNYGGHAWTDTADKKFGDSAIEFDGALDSNFTIASGGPALSSKPQAQDFCIDVHANFDTLPITAGEIYTFLADFLVTGNNRQWIFRLTDTEKLQFVYYEDGVSASIAQVDWTPTINTWYHVRVSREGQNFYLFVDGVLLGTHDHGSTADIHASDGNDIRVGELQALTHQFDGSLDAIRITIGAARTTTTFTPPDFPWATNV